MPGVLIATQYYRHDAYGLYALPRHYPGAMPQSEISLHHMRTSDWFIYLHAATPRSSVRLKIISTFDTMHG